MSKADFYQELRDYGDKLGSVLDGLQTCKSSGQETVVTPRELVFELDKLKLYHYLSDQTTSDSIPVLIVYALVNRPSILDLQKQHSAVQKMLDNGLDVYLIDWGYPERSDSHLTLDDYVNKRIDRCVDIVCDLHQQDKISVLGVCQGGVLSLCYSALHAERVRNLVLMVTPVDFHTPDDLLSQWVRSIDVDLLVDTMGNVPGSLLSNTFLALKPYQLQLKKYLDLIDTIDQANDNCERVANFMAMEEWIFDSPDQAGEMFREFITSCYQQNKLVKGELEVGGQTIDLGKLLMPVLNVYAEQDHLVPPPASKALTDIIGSDDYQEMQVPGGHIGIFVSRKSLNSIFPAIAEWLSARN